MKAHHFKFLVTMLLLHFAVLSSAQEERKFTVREGMTISETLPDSAIYLYPHFVKGIVIFNTGKQIDVVMNYNLILGKIQFIRNAKDTLAVSNPQDVKIFIAGSDRYMFDDVYYRILIATPKILLACHEYTKTLEVRKETGYGLASPTTAVDSYSFITAADNSGLYKLRASAETIYSITTDYYFGTERNEFSFATQKNLLKMYPGKAEEIKKYIKENKLNFKKRPDLEKLVGFINDLPD
jgi:hypothetical protein